MLNLSSVAKLRMITRTHHVIVLVASTLFGCLMALYYWYIIVVIQVPMDIQYHLHYISENMCAERQLAPANAGFYYIVWLLSGFTCEYSRVLKTGVLFLGICWGAVAYFSFYIGVYLKNLQKNEITKNNKFSNNQLFCTLIISIASCIIFPIPLFKYYYYLGLLPPNIYFNSTWVASLPFTIIVFGLSIKQLQLRRPGLQIEILIGIFLVISAWFKPSFAFVFVPSYALMRISKNKWQQWHLLWVPFAISLLPVTVLIVLQTLWIIDNPQTLLGGKTNFAFSFPAGWFYTLPNLPARHMVIRFLCSFALPIIGYLLRPSWLKSIQHQIALLCTVFGFIIFMTIHETGERAIHGNFAWQVISSNHLLYWVTMVSLMNWQPVSMYEFRRRFLFTLVVAAHLVSGITYLIITVLHKSYV